MNILLACAAGMSTSFLVSKMNEVVKEQGKTYKIWATDIDSIPDEDDPFDVILLGPQLAYRFDEVLEMLDEMEIKVPVELIDKQEYGKCDGLAVLQQAERLVK